MTRDNSPQHQSAEIVSLWQHKEKREVSAISELRGYWESLRSGRMVPLRSEIDPREISSALEFGFVLEHLQPGAVRFRLAGAHLSDLMGMEVNGMPMRSFIAPASRARFSTLLERVFTQPEIHEYVLVSDDRNTAPLRARLLILPLKSDGGKVDRAIGCLVTEGVVGIAPRRFRVLETRITSLINGEQTCEVEENEYPEAPQPKVAGFAEFQDGFEAKPEPAPVLKLVVSDGGKA